jgi:hypothetical protein
MEERFGRDFGTVRVHIDDRAKASARAVDARAYTVGETIVFADAAAANRSLLAHELTHTIQQSGAARGPWPSEITIASERTTHEHEAAEQGAGSAVDCSISPAPIALQRQPAGAPVQDPPITVFVADPSRRRDQRFARREARSDAADLDRKGALTPEDRSTVKAKLRFFEGDARAVYAAEIRPALLRATRPEIEMPAMYVGHIDVADPVEQERIRKRRQHTYRAFAGYSDMQLERRYRSRLQLYLDQGMEANNDWDLEMIEQIISERAPKAPWHQQARQEFLEKRARKLLDQQRKERLPTLSDYWQNQIGVVREQTEGWPPELQTWAQDLIWKWSEHPGDGESVIFKDVVSQFESFLRDRDRSIQQECAKDPPSRLEKVWGDPCKPWFSEDSDHGEQIINHLQRVMRIRKDEYDRPCFDVVYWLQAYMNVVASVPRNKGERHLQILQTWATVQGAFALAAQPGKTIRFAPPATVVAESLKAGEIVVPGARTGLGPMRVVAPVPGLQMEVLEPVMPAPRPERTLSGPAPTTASAAERPVVPVNPPSSRIPSATPLEIPEPAAAPKTTQPAVQPASPAAPSIDVRGEPGPGGTIRIRGAPAVQPSASAVKRAELAVTGVVIRRWGTALRDISELAKAPTAPGVDRLFVLGRGDGVVLLEVDAKLSIQEGPVTIRDVSSFETAGATGGRSRLELLEKALARGQITQHEFNLLKESVQQGLVFEEVHGFGSVSGISDDLRQEGVTYAQGEQFAHVEEKVAAQKAKSESLEIKVNLVPSAVDRRSAKTIAAQIWRDFEEVFGKH